MSTPYVRLDKNNAAVLLVDHQAGLLSLVRDIDNMPITGVVTFMLEGQEQKLEAVGEEGLPQLWFIFRDLTSQDETYPAARFLYTPLPVNGKLVMDFNRAQNPPCAYNPYTTCPLPSEQNRLRVRIEAGEKKYHNQVN